MYDGNEETRYFWIGKALQILFAFSEISEIRVKFT